MWWSWTAGGAWGLPGAEVTPQGLAARLEALLGAPASLAEAGAAARRLGLPDAASRLADAVEALAAPGRNGASDARAREDAA